VAATLHAESGSPIRHVQSTVEDLIEIAIPGIDQVGNRISQAHDLAESPAASHDDVLDVRRSHERSRRTRDVPDLTRPDWMVLGKNLFVVCEQAETGS